MKIFNNESIYVNIYLGKKEYYNVLLMEFYIELVFVWLSEDRTKGETNSDKMNIFSKFIK